MNRRRIAVFSIVPDESSRLALVLPRAPAPLAYELQGTIECDLPPRRTEFSQGPISIVCAYGVARLRGAGELETVPPQIEFHLARPVRADLSGRPFGAELEFIFPELLRLRAYRSIPGPGHAFLTRPAKSRIQLRALWDPGFGGPVISGLGRILVPTISPKPLLAALLCCCPCPPVKPKCKTMCLSIKVGPKANGQPVLTKDEVKAVVKRVNEIWGCKTPGQCCIEFTIADNDITLKPPGLPAKVKVKTGEAHQEHRKAVKIARSTTCYNIYYVEESVPDPAGNTSYPGLTLRDQDSSSLLQNPPNYTNETRATVMAHELGHALGLAWDDGTDDKGVDKHSKKPTNLMHNVANLGSELNADQCAKARESSLLKDTDHECELKPDEV